MDGVEVSVMGWSLTIVNVSPCTRPSCVRNSLMCIKAGGMYLFKWLNDVMHPRMFFYMSSLSL